MASYFIIRNSRRHCEISVQVLSLGIGGRYDTLPPIRSPENHQVMIFPLVVRCHPMTPIGAYHGEIVLISEA
jgi:hypothetical protein